MSENPFADKYKTLTNIQLLEVLQFPENYQSLAIEAAHLELNQRKLSDEELLRAKEIIQERNRKEEERIEKINSIKEKTSSIGFNFLSALNPIQVGVINAERYMRLITVFLLLGVFVDLYSSLPHILHYNFFTLPYVLSLVFGLVCLITFWKRMKAGWILTSIMYCIGVIISISGIILALTFASRDVVFVGHFSNKEAVFSSLSKLVIYGGLLLVLFRSDIREVYSIDKKVIYIYSAIIGLATLVLIYKAIS